MDTELSKLIENGATVVTPTERLSRHISFLFSQEKINQRKSWITPHCLSWDSWCRIIFDKLLFSKKGQWILINNFQQQWLFEEIIRNSKYSDQLLRVDTTSKEVINCYRLCKEWDISIFPKNIDLPEDANAFRQWVNLYENKKRNNFWLDSICLPDYIASRINEFDFNPNGVTFYGFDQLTKQQSNLKKLLIDLKIYNEIQAGKDRNQSIEFSIQDDLDSEIKAAACWAKKKLENDKTATIGIIFRDINKIRNKIEYGFSSVLTPEKWTKFDFTPTKPYSISMGKSLLTYPLIYVAVNLLSLSANKISVRDLSNLLNSPYIRLNGGAKLDEKLRKFGETEISLEQLLSINDKECRDFIEALVKFKKSFEIDVKKNMKFSMWVTNFTKWLKIFKWPNKQLDSDEYQTLQKWNEALRNLGSIAEFDQSIDFKTAFTYLKNILAEIHFQPKAHYETPIQIIGMTGVAGAKFDYLWVTNARDDNWQTTSPDFGFIPYECQMMLPGRTPESRLKITKNITNELVRSSKNLIFSYIRQEGDDDRVRLSPLIMSTYKPKKIDEIFEDDYTKEIFDIEAIEEIEDFNAPEIKIGNKVSAGSSLLEDQSACPFRAFAKHRLNAHALDEPNDDLDSAGRGKLVHRIMEILWEKLENSKNLELISQNKLENIICISISKGLAEAKSKRPGIFKAWFVDLEHRRLKDLLKEWLVIEKNRSEFLVYEKEKVKKVIFGGIEFNLRIDRVDKLDANRYLIIDYKTGKVTKANWTKDRLKEPQLPLYAITSEHPISGIAYACLKTNEYGFDGYTDSDEIFSRETRVKVLDISELLVSWEKVLENLTKEFMRGHAAVDPRPDACTYCDLANLCRIRERI